MVSSSVTDDVVAAARLGDAAAVTAIWRDLSPLVAGYLRARGVEDPDGLTSDVFLSVLPRLSELRGGAAGLRTFVFSVAHARAVDEARRRSRRPAVVEFDPTRHDSPVVSAEQEAIGRLEIADITEQVAQLLPDHREVLALRVVADLSLEQTASVMGRSVGSVKQLQRRALLALRAAVETATAVTEGSCS